MTLPQNVADAVKLLDYTAGPQRQWVSLCAWKTIRAHLISQEAEIARVKSIADAHCDGRLTAIARLAAANALLRDIKDWDVNAAQGMCLMVPLRLRKRIQSHLQGAGDEA